MTCSMQVRSATARACWSSFVPMPLPHESRRTYMLASAIVSVIAGLLRQGINDCHPRTSPLEPSHTQQPNPPRPCQSSILRSSFAWDASSCSLTSLAPGRAIQISNILGMSAAFAGRIKGTHLQVLGARQAAFTIQTSCCARLPLLPSMSLQAHIRVHCGRTRPWPR